MPRAFRAFNAANLNYDIAPLPLPWSGKRANQAGGARWLMNAKRQNKDAAWTFMTFLNSAEGGNAIYAKTGGMFPAQKSVADVGGFHRSQSEARQPQHLYHRGCRVWRFFRPAWCCPPGTTSTTNIIGRQLWAKCGRWKTTPDKTAAAVCPAVNEALKKAGYPK